MINSIKLNFADFKEYFFKSKKYCIIYLLLICLAIMTLFNLENYQHPKFEIFSIIIVSIFSIFSLVYYYKNGNKKLYKMAFIVLLLFGLICAFIIPIDSVSDGYEHLTRAEMTSRGVLLPEYINGSYESISSLPNFFNNVGGKTVFQINDDTSKINNSVAYVDSAFEQNPFYGYIFSAIGIAIAKFFDLNVIWMLWLGRFFNVIIYAALISLAIKKSPIFKIQLFAISCLPICLFQAFSISIDSLTAGLGIFTIAYFFNMHVNKFGKRQIVIFSLLCLLTGLCKIPYLALIFLILFIPHDNFNKNGFNLYCVLSIGLVAVIGLLWNNLYASPALYHSWRAEYFIQNNVNVSNQLNYIISHPMNFVVAIFSILNSIPTIFSSFFNFYNGGEYCGSQFISMLLTFFVAFISFYPNDIKINLKSRIGVFITFIIIFVGTYIVQLLSWNPVGQLTFNGVHARYFLALFALLPFIFANNFLNFKGKKLDNYTIVLILFFMSSMVISFATTFY